jgi:hypothetical protein
MDYFMKLDDLLRGSNTRTQRFLDSVLRICGGSDFVGASFRHLAKKNIFCHKFQFFENKFVPFFH